MAALVKVAALRFRSAPTGAGRGATNPQRGTVDDALPWHLAEAMEALDARREVVGPALVDASAGVV